MGVAHRRRPEVSTGLSRGAAVKKWAARLLTCLVLAGALLPARAASTTGDRTVSEVVNVLKGLLDKSKSDGEQERVLFAKHKCYCDSNEASKKADIERLSGQIALLEGQIEEVKGSTGQGSKDASQLQADMAENRASQGEAAAAREKESAAFQAKAADLESAIGAMNAAIGALAEIGADQTLNSGADHEQITAAGQSLVQVRPAVREALLTASAFVSKTQSPAVAAFLQAPFTGTYAARSGEVVGILKDMRDTFRTSLQSAYAEDAKAAQAYDKFVDTMSATYAALEKQYGSTQSLLSGNDADLSSKKVLLQGAVAQKAEAEEFLGSLLPMCAAKKAQYDKRVELRRNEEVALSQALYILNSDEAFATFGNVEATSFVQRRAIRRHQAAPADAEPRRERAGAFLQRASAAGGAGAPLLRRVLALLQAGNPFTVVLAEIDKMVQLISAEEKADDEKKAWCGSEQTSSANSIDKKAGQITTMQSAINEIKNAIDNPTTGLKVTLAKTEESLRANHASQAAETATRESEKAEFAKNVAHLAKAEDLIQKAIVVLQTYYKKITAALQTSLLQAETGRDGPAPPVTFGDTYSGQSEAGSKVIETLQYILTNAKAEEANARQTEADAAKDYEASMATLKSGERVLLDAMASTKTTLAEREQALIEKEKDLAATSQEKDALEAYLKDIKPGCDFISSNLDARKAHRKSETEALQKAVELLKSTPLAKA